MQVFQSPVVHSDALTLKVAGAVQATLSQFAAQALSSDEIAVTVLNENSELGSHRGNTLIHPASIVKLFYLAAAHRWLEDGRIEDTLELRHALRDMIVDSANDATHYVVDLLTGTTTGPELPPEEMARWEEKRDTVNRYFQSTGYSNLNIKQKTWNDGPYGRERVFAVERTNNQNALTTNATAQLLAEIAGERCVSAARSRQMLQLLERNVPAETANATGLQHSFFAAGVPHGTILHSKAGWTSQNRHDAALMQFPNGTQLILVAFTARHSQHHEILPALARNMISALYPL